MMRFGFLSSINNGNCTEWSAIWAEIIRVILDRNCTTLGSITTITSILKSPKYRTWSVQMFY